MKRLEHRCETRAFQTYSAMARSWSPRRIEERWDLDASPISELASG